MVVKKIDSSFFRDVELAVFNHYRALMGWKMRTNRAKLVRESLSVACILTMGMGDVGVHFQVGLLVQKQKQTKEHTLSKMYEYALPFKAKGLMYFIISDNRFPSK